MATPESQRPPPPSRDDFAIAIICALPEERDTVEALMTRDYKGEGHPPYGKTLGDDNIYTFGEIGGKPVVLAAPRGMGTTNTRDLARGLKISFRNILYAFVVGIAGGAPFRHDGDHWEDSDIHLGDVIVSTHVIEYDFGKDYENGFRRRTDVENVLPRAPAEVANFVNQFVRGRSMAFQRILRKTNADLARCERFETGENEFHEHPGPGKDDVYALEYRHRHQDPEVCVKCSQCTEWYHEVCEEALTASCQMLGCKPNHSNAMRDTKIHFGRYASGNAVMKNGHRRDLLIQNDNVIGFEMEGAGAWEVFGTIVVKGVVDYADSHKSKQWRGYPAARAALCAAAMIEEIELPDQPHAAEREIPQRSRANSLPVTRHCVLPRRSNPQYFGYSHILDRLASCLLWRGSPQSRSQIVCVLSGMGGVGKSETILQFLDKNAALRERYWAILWVDCESEASAQADFEKISKKCDWLSDNVKDQLSSSKWPSLLILDNCDDVKTDYNRYIPNGPQVSVVMTTRLSDAKKYASAHPDPRDPEKKLFMRLDGMDTDSAIDLVLEASDIEERTPVIIDQAQKIATALDFHPLALKAASSLIRSAVYSLGEYVHAIETRLAQKELLETESEQARYLKVSTTFEVSADSLLKSASTDPTAKAALALLDVLGFMHHQDVSEEIFVRAWEYEEKVLIQFEDKDEDGNVNHLSAWHVTQSRSIFASMPPDERIHLFRKARARLHRLSLVNIEQVEKCMSIHLVVHTWARERVSRHDETCKVVASILALSAQAHRWWQPFTPQLVRHLETNFAFWQILPMGGTLSDQWGLCRILCTYAWQMSRVYITRALDVCLQLDLQTQQLPCSRYSAATVKLLLGRAYRDNAQNPEAIRALESLAGMEGELSESNRLVSQHELALVYRDNGQTTKGIEILEHVVRVREEKLREDHPDLLASQHVLATLYLNSGQTTRAIEILEHVVRVGEQRQREDHPGRLASQHELARAYYESGQIEKALKIQEEVVTFARRTYRAGHPERTTMVVNLAGYTAMLEKELQDKALTVRTQASPS